MSDPGEAVSDQHLEVTVVHGDGARHAVMLRDPRTEQSVALLLSDRHDVDRAIWLKMRHHIGNSKLRRASDKVVSYAAERPDWDVHIEFESSITADVEVAIEPDSAPRRTNDKWRWWPGAAVISGIGASLSAGLAFAGVATAFGTPFGVTAAGWTETAMMGVSIVFAATVFGYSAVLVTQMRETSAMADDLATARRHLGRAADHLAVVRRFGDLKRPAG